MPLSSRATLGELLGESGSTLDNTVRRLVGAGVLEHVCHNVYLYTKTRCRTWTLADQIAEFVRPGHITFESLESAASLWGIVSQIPVGVFTYMTTGRSGIYHTRYGQIVLVHTQLPREYILANTVPRRFGRIRLANKRFTAQCMVNCRSNVHLIDWEEVESDD